ncbi:hypothetical protein COCVIDRAFT_15881 [Bipolaris victoriae FI3]|uniref:Uncharacterized protein n=1 Tax=Bipolaris victoriae (strain FI3) TaxID=930091 RepID=W7E9P0_BIPV3|nr:hypothetical protein COCVIDRAFT_15881 [Bipolaris victoriae FI3]
MIIFARPQSSSLCLPQGAPCPSSFTSGKMHPMIQASTHSTTSFHSTIGIPPEKPPRQIIAAEIMKYLATIIDLALALAPGTMAQSTACCLSTPWDGSSKAYCSEKGTHVACNCDNRGTFRTAWPSGHGGFPDPRYPCTGGGQARCVGTLE